MFQTGLLFPSPLKICSGHILPHFSSWQLHLFTYWNLEVLKSWSHSLWLQTVRPMCVCYSMISKRKEREKERERNQVPEHQWWFNGWQPNPEANMCLHQFRASSNSKAQITEGTASLPPSPGKMEKMGNRDCLVSKIEPTHYWSISLVQSNSSSISY